MNNDQVEVLEYGFASLVFCFGAIWLRLKQITHEDEVPVKVISEPETNVGPYRTSAPKPQEYIEERDALLDSIKQIVNKKEYHMSEHTIKIIKMIVCILPSIISAVCIGALYDANGIGIGTKWGITVALLIVSGITAATAVAIGDDEF